MMMQNVTVRLARPGSPPAALPVDGLATGTADTWVLQPAAAPPLLDQLRSAEAAPTVPAEAPAANPWILPAMSPIAKAAFRALSVTAEHKKRRQENTDACIARALAGYEAEHEFPTPAEAAGIPSQSRHRQMGPPPPRTPRSGSLRSARSGSRRARSQSVSFREPIDDATPPPSPSRVSAVPFVPLADWQPDAETDPVEPSAEPAPGVSAVPVEPSGEPASGVSAAPVEPSGEPASAGSAGNPVLNVAVTRLRSHSPSRIGLADAMPALQQAFAKTAHPLAPPETQLPPASADIRCKEPAPPQATPPAAASALHRPGGAASSVDASSPNVADPRRRRDMLADTVVAVAQAWGAPTNRDIWQHTRPAPRRGWHAESGYAPPDAQQLLIQGEIAASFNLDQALPLFSPLRGIPCGRQLCTPSPLTLRVE